MDGLLPRCWPVLRQCIRVQECVVEQRCLLHGSQEAERDWGSDLGQWPQECAPQSPIFSN